jgi:hypothetical protein
MRARGLKKSIVTYGLITAVSVVLITLLWIVTPGGAWFFKTAQSAPKTVNPAEFSALLQAGGSLEETFIFKLPCATKLDGYDALNPLNYDRLFNSVVAVTEIKVTNTGEADFVLKIEIEQGEDSALFSAILLSSRAELADEENIDDEGFPDYRTQIRDNLGVAGCAAYDAGSVTQKRGILAAYNAARVLELKSGDLVLSPGGEYECVIVSWADYDALIDAAHVDENDEPIFVINPDTVASVGFTLEIKLQAVDTNAP